jgi:carboxylesterase type B
VRGVLLGSTADEGRLLMPSTMPVANAPFSTAADLRAWFRANFPAPDPAALDALYAADSAADGPWGAAANAYTDGQYLCPTARSARWLAAAGVAEVYTYRLEYAPQMYGTLGELAYWQVWCRDYARCANATARSIRVGHGADVPLLFHDARLNATDRVVARTLA